MAIDVRYRRKPAKEHPWVGWKPGWLSSKDAERKREPPPRRRLGRTLESTSPTDKSLIRKTKEA